MAMWFNDFLSDERGTSSVEWVVLTAVTVGMGVASLAIIKDGAGSAGEDLGSSLENDGQQIQPVVRVVHDAALVDALTYSLNGWTDSELTTLTAFMDDMLAYFDANRDELSSDQHNQLSDLDLSVDLTWESRDSVRPTDGTWTEEEIQNLPELEGSEQLAFYGY